MSRYWMKGRPPFDHESLYRSAFRKGRQVGYNQGYLDGFEEGYEKGYREGINLGYNNGFLSAMETKDGSRSDLRANRINGNEQKK